MANAYRGIVNMRRSWTKLVERRFPPYCVDEAEPFAQSMRDNGHIVKITRYRSGKDGGRTTYGKCVHVYQKPTNEGGSK